jgi:hypothetical protein
VFESLSQPRIVWALVRSSSRHLLEEKMGIRAKKAKKAAPKRRPRKKTGAKKKAAKKK